jgi:hypothetical protein
LPVGRLDKLIKLFGDDLAIDAEVYLAANPKTPAIIKAENAAWMQRQGMGLPTQGDPATHHSKAAGPMGEATKFDELLARGFPAWVAQADKEKARKEKGKKWTR